MSARPPGTLPPGEGYRLWAAGYDAENPVSHLDQLAVQELTPPLGGTRLLDAGCGTGRRLPADRTVWAAGVDVARDMLLTGRRRGRRQLRLINADVRHLPVRAGAFDVVWCRLALSHLPALADTYREFVRITRPGACVIVTDFHPEAARAGHRRTFRGPGGELRAVAYQAHEPSAHADAARAAGFAPDTLRELEVGPAVRNFYEQAAALDRYERQMGLPLVFAWRFIREPHAGNAR